MYEKIGTILEKIGLGFLFLLTLGALFGAAFLFLTLVWEIGNIAVGGGWVGIATLVGILILCYIVGHIAKVKEPWNL